MPHFTLEAQLSQAGGSRRLGGQLVITPSDPSLMLTYWRPGEEDRTSCSRHQASSLSLDAVEGMIFHCSAWKGERRVAKFSVNLDWRGVWYEMAWHAKMTVLQEHPAKEHILNLPW